MYGPLVMTTEEITDWAQTDIDLSSDLSDILLMGPTADTGTNGNLYRLSLAGKNFVPDYYETGESTHYLRLNVMTGARKGSGKVSKAELESALKVANERKEAQEAWNALTVKVPAHSPWAPNGYARMLQSLQLAEAVNDKSAKELTQAEVNSALSALNAVINTMRPGNLAEPEDLNSLQPLLTQAKRIRNKTTELREAIDYADMVVDYVNNGSGTHDLIEKATAGLNEALKTVSDQMPQRRNEQ